MEEVREVLIPEVVKPNLRSLCHAKRKEAKDIDWLGCWAHVRRKFFKSKEDSAYASWILRQIQLLYAVESKTKDHGPGLREAVRASESKMILDRIFKSMRKLLAHHLPSHFAFEFPYF